MQSLIFAILSSALVSIIMRLSEEKVTNKMSFFLANYAVCTLLGVFFTVQGGGVRGTFSPAFPILFGCLSGFLFLYSFVLFRKNVARNGVVMSATFMKLGVLIPTLMAILIFREQPRVPQILGICLAVAAILLLHLEPGSTGLGSGKWLLLLLLFLSGLTDGTANIYDKLGAPEGKDLYLVFTFLTAMVFSGILAFAAKQRICLWDIGFGAAIGIPNYFSSRFLLGALRTVPAVVVYPVYSVATIVVITAFGVLLFREKLGLRKLLALLIIFAALALLNL